MNNQMTNKRWQIN